MTIQQQPRFNDLDEDTQILVREFGEAQYGPLDDDADFPVSLDQIACEYLAAGNIALKISSAS